MNVSHLQSSQPQLQLQTSPQLSQQHSKYLPRPRQAMASLQFQPMQSMPVLYPQPAVIPDPNWYYQQQMMMYQLSPQQFVPAQYTQMVQPGPVFPVNQPYSVNPGSIGQPNIVSPIARQPPSMRLPVVSPPGAVVEQVASSPHPSGVTLVRPVPQQASPVRVSVLQYHCPHFHALVSVAQYCSSPKEQRQGHGIALPPPCIHVHVHVHRAN